ncbi:MAG: nuclear transport factor 2 family protein [Phycisphaerales bacterium]
MTTATSLAQKHIETLVDDPATWETLIDDDIEWELVYAPSLGHPARLSGRSEVNRHINWFRGAVERLKFYDVRVQEMADPDLAVAEVRAEALVKSTGRVYRQEYLFILRSRNGKILKLREYFDPVKAATAMEIPLPGSDADAGS